MMKLTTLAQKGYINAGYYTSKAKEKLTQLIHSNSGFELVTVLVIVAIILVLGALLLAFLQATFGKEDGSTGLFKVIKDQITSLFTPAP